MGNPRVKLELSKLTDKDDDLVFYGETKAKAEDIASLVKNAGVSMETAFKYLNVSERRKPDIMTYIKENNLL